MKYAFLLDKPNSKEPTYIFIKGTFGSPLKKSLKEKIYPNHWDFSHRRPFPDHKNKKLKDDLRALKSKLDRIADRMDEMIRESKRTGNPLLTSMIEAEIDRLLNKTKTSKDFAYYADLIYIEMESGVIQTPQGKRYEKQTLTNYDQSIRQLKGFKPSLQFSEITMETYSKFIAYCNNQNLSMNSTGCHIKCWKRLISIAFDKGYHTNKIFMDKRFKAISEETEGDIYLDESEIKILYQKRLLDRVQEWCRDWFVLDCYTGLRISDIQQLNHGLNVTSTSIIISNEKTDAVVEIPLHPIVKEILKKYKGFPPKVSDQEVNREIKKVAELCKMNETVLYSMTKGGRRQDFYYKKFEMISNHSARRSFITNLRKSGVPDSIVMKLSGIVKATTLQKYDKLTPKEAAKIASEHSFFK